MFMNQLRIIWGVFRGIVKHGRSWREELAASTPLRSLLRHRLQTGGVSGGNRRRIREERHSA
jgi:hypothetical protein